MAGALLGTPAYMSLEQLQGKTIDARADQFSFCMVAYEALYGEPPFAIDLDDQTTSSRSTCALASGAIRPPPVGHARPGRAARDRDPRACIVAGGSLARSRRAARRARHRARTGDTAAAHDRRDRSASDCSRSRLCYGRCIARVKHLQATSARPESRCTPSLHSRREERLAIGTDRVEVRDLRSKPSVDPSRWWRLGSTAPVSRRRCAALSVPEQPGILRWDFEHGGAPVVEPLASTGTWLGSIDGGDLVERRRARRSRSFAAIARWVRGRLIPARPSRSSYRLRAALRVCGRRSIQRAHRGRRRERRAHVAVGAGRRSYRSSRGSTITRCSTRAPCADDRVA